MNHLHIQKRPIDFKEFVKRSAVESDASQLIQGDTLVYSNGVPAILYAKLDVDLSELLWATQRIKYEKNVRTTGLKTESAIFGYNPRNVIRKDYCSATRMAYTQKQEHAIIADFGVYLSNLYQQYFPATYETHAAFVEEKIRPEWKIRDTPFTSGIVNRNNPLKYHFDAGNIKSVLSNMVVLKKDVQGGRLVCPEFDITLDCADGTVVLFDGQQIMHGVTPIIRTTAAAYRYSVVYYSLLQMWQCLPLNEEIARIRKIHTQRERNRAAGTVNADQLQHD